MVKQRLKVESHNIDSIGYSPEHKLLEVVFKTDPDVTYRYHNVPEKVFVDLVTGDSVGSYFAKSIRPNPKAYPFDKVMKTEIDKIAGTSTTLKKARNVSAEEIAEHPTHSLRASDYVPGGDPQARRNTLKKSDR